VLSCDSDDDNVLDCPSGVVDECGVCDGDGILEPYCDCDGNEYDCDEVCGGDNIVVEPFCNCDGDTTFDECGECGGTNSSCLDCEGIPNGSAIEDCGGGCNEYVQLFEECYNIETTTSLNFTNAGLTYLPETIADLINLEGLYLHNNQLTSLPETFCNLPEICIIYVHSNNLCEEFHYDCISDYEWELSGDAPQDQSNCCEGVNDDGETVDNWTTCP
jgi:hypothetical protein